MLSVTNNFYWIGKYCKALLDNWRYEQVAALFFATPQVRQAVMCQSLVARFFFCHLGPTCQNQKCVASFPWALQRVSTILILCPSSLLFLVQAPCRNSQMNNVRLLFLIADGCFKCGAPDHIARDCDQDGEQKPKAPNYVLKDDNTQRGGNNRRRSLSISSLGQLFLQRCYVL